MFDNIPAELQALNQWVVWRYEYRDGVKPTKVPYDPKTGNKAKVDDPTTWASFAEACAVADQHGGQTTDCGPGVAGIGFVLTKEDEYGFIDLDDTHDDVAAYDRQFKIYNSFDSYSEKSPGGNGLHIIVKGAVPMGRKRAFIEVYSELRYMTMTGNVVNPKPIEERNELLNILWNEMGGPPIQTIYGEDQEQKHSDEEIVTMAQRAANGDKFTSLFVGNWRDLYHSQSEADFALVDIIAFYTQNKAQIARIFRASELGQRDKAQRDRYIEYMVNKSFDRQLPPIDIEGLLIQFRTMAAAEAAPAPVFNYNGEFVEVLAGQGAAEPERTAAPAGLEAFDAMQPAGQGAPPTPGQQPPSAASLGVSSFPPGLVGEVAQFIMEAAPRPVPEIALAGAVGFVAGISGRAYNISRTGLNQYILLLANTGRGKEAIALGTDKLMQAIKNTVPTSAEFTGPAVIASQPALVKWMEKAPAIYCIIGEFGNKMAEMANPKVNPHTLALKTAFLDIYGKSGAGGVYQSMAYSDKEKNTKQIFSPALTLIGESVPTRFYETLDEDIVADGLLPRFTIFEYVGPRPPISLTYMNARPQFATLEKLAALCAHSQTLAHNQRVQDVDMTDEAKALLDKFDKWADHEINSAKDMEVVAELWNRAHLKALKLAATVAVGINYVNPVIDIQTATWATDIIATQTNKLVAKFRSGEVGSSSGNEAKQCQEVVKCIKTYMTEPFERYAQYGGLAAMHGEGVIMADHIQRRLVSMSMFRNDRIGATAAIKRAIGILIEAGDIQELPRSQVQTRFGKAARAFVVTDPTRFLAV